MKIKNYLFLAISILAASSLRAAEAISILQGTLANPTQPYQGRMIVTHWYEKGSQSEDIRVWFSPPKTYRWEFLKPQNTAKELLQLQKR